MRVVILLGAWLVGIPLGLRHQAAGLASRLVPGTQLFYVSDGRAQPPWVVDSVQTGQPLKPGADCASLTLRRRPEDPKPERSRLCLASDTLYRWEKAAGAWVVFRPVGPDMAVTLVKANGDSVHYETGALGEDMVSGNAIGVVSTTVTTVDASGRARLRVQERYAISLATATSGTFEAPDPAAPGRWVVRHTFALKELRPGSR